MNNFLDILNLIKNKYKEHGYEKLADYLTECQLSGGTIGEVFAIIAFNLNKIKKENFDAYSIAKKEIDEIIEYAYKLNYLQ